MNLLINDTGTIMTPRELIHLILKRCESERLLDPMRTRLVKLIYLAELEYVRRTGKRLTNLSWKFHHFGPYAQELTQELGDMSAGTIDIERLLNKLNDREPHADHVTEIVIRDVVHSWGDADLNRLLDYVYFDTEPMQAASRGGALDFGHVSKWQPASPTVSLDKKRIRDLQRKLKSSAANYGAMRKLPTADYEYFENKNIWDEHSDTVFGPGNVYIDPSDLVSDDDEAL